MSIVNVISVSGGKDSTAVALLAIERETENTHFVFADTGHEHDATYEYIDRMERHLGITIARVKEDFSERIDRKRETVQTKWRKEGVSEERIARALEVLQPTGIPFLDLCLWKGRFPSTKRRFCTQELKVAPIQRYHLAIMEGREALISWQGIRRDESIARSKLPMHDVECGAWEPSPKGSLIYRPIIDWSAADTFDIAKRHGIAPNELYFQGMGRVGCMPCIHVNKGELLAIASRYPEEIERVAEWERLVSEASKRGVSTMLDGRRAQRLLGDDEFKANTHGIRLHAEWAKTARGGFQYDMLKSSPEDGCSSIYGLCE